MCEYKAEMKCTWTAESSRMKGSVQLGLLCLSLLISSLHGEVETDNSMQLSIHFEEPDLDQPEVRDELCWQYFTEVNHTGVKRMFMGLFFFLWYVFP